MRTGWNETPADDRLPREIGILALTLEGTPVESPAWDAEGVLWLKRNGSTEEADKDFLGVKVYAVIEDGIPSGCALEIELIVSARAARKRSAQSCLKAGDLPAVSSPHSCRGG